MSLDTTADLIRALQKVLEDAEPMDACIATTAVAMVAAYDFEKSAGTPSFKAAIATGETLARVICTTEPTK